PTKVALHGEVSERRLRERAEEDREREPNDPARQPSCPPCAEPREERESDRHAADDAVRELDERVHVLRRERMTRFASWPVAAAEPRVGQTDGGTGADDQPQREELCNGDTEELRRREREPADPRKRGGGRVHAPSLEMA